MTARALSVVIMLAAISRSGVVRAEVERQARRPVKIAALEVNPLAALAKHFGGQVHLGVVDVLGIVGTVGYVTSSHTRHYDEYDDRVEGHVGYRGLKLEIGPRIHFPFGREGGRDVWFWVQPSFYQQRLSSPVPTAMESPTHDLDHWTLTVRNGGAADIGVHVAVERGFYVSTGLGMGFVVGTNRDVDFTPRFLAACGWGY